MSVSTNLRIDRGRAPARSPLACSKPMTPTLARSTLSLHGFAPVTNRLTRTERWRSQLHSALARSTLLRFLECAADTRCEVAAFAGDGQKFERDVGPGAPANQCAPRPGARPVPIAIPEIGDRDAAKRAIAMARNTQSLSCLFPADQQSRGELFPIQDVHAQSLNQCTSPREFEQRTGR